MSYQSVTAVEVNFDETKRTTGVNEFGMRPMQARAYAKRDARHLLIKSPPASGKSRCLMYLSLDKIAHQGWKKVIVAVPEVSIGASFSNTDLRSGGFFADWNIEPKWDLCDPGADTGDGAKSKVKALLQFLESDSNALICTHATLRFAYQQAGIEVFDGCVVAIDEFHHASSDDESKLGAFIKDALGRNKVSLIAMTGSYFRGDDAAIMAQEDEEMFTVVSYTYWEQMANYEHLKSIRINYHFYSAIDGSYLQALPRVFDFNKKTIIHIPHRNSPECAGSKYDELDAIIDMIGTPEEKREEDTGFWRIQGKDGNLYILADLIDDNPDERVKVQNALRDKQHQNRVDFITALGMAKEGFDWPQAEHAITVAYRGSLTEIIQILGRVTRDYEGKTQATMTQLLAEPRADDDEVVNAVNAMLKAISVSLAMEQALAPKFRFISKRPNNPELGMGEEDEATGEITIAIAGMKEATSDTAKEIIKNQLPELIAAVTMDKGVIRALADENTPPEIIQDVHISRVIEARFPNETPENIEAIRQQVAAHMAMAAIGNGMSGAEAAGVLKGFDDENKGTDDIGSKSFVNLVRKFININELHVDLIDSINPFGRAYEVLSKGLTSDVLMKVHGAARTQTIQMSEQEALALWPRIEQFTADNGREPNFASANALEKRLGEALEWLRRKIREQQSQGES